MLRLRVGLLLILISWIPIAQFIIANDQGLSTGAAQELRLKIWGIQILVGFVGLYLAGKIAVQTAKSEGWKKTPKNLWHLFKGEKEDKPTSQE